MSLIEEKVIVSSPILETDSQSKFLKSQNVLEKINIQIAKAYFVSGLTSEMYSSNKIEESANR